MCVMSDSGEDKREIKHVRFELPKEEYEELNDFKEKRGLTWAGVMKYGTIVET